MKRPGFIYDSLWNYFGDLLVACSDISKMIRDGLRELGELPTY